jgi:hypothetical protein
MNCVSLMEFEPPISCSLLFPAYPQLLCASSRLEPVVISPAVSDSAASLLRRLHLGLARAYAVESAGSCASIPPPRVFRSSSAPVVRGGSPLFDSFVGSADAQPPVRWCWLQCAAGYTAGRGLSERVWQNSPCQYLRSEFGLRASHGTY